MNIPSYIYTKIVQTQPCGFLTDPTGRCSCTHTQVQRYQAKISGPLLDRVDIQIDVPKVAYKDLSKKILEEGSQKINERVAEARDRQVHRFKKIGIHCNGLMSNRHIKSFCPLSADCEKLLEQAVDVMGFSARACHSIIRLGRTIADLHGQEQIQPDHLAEAINLRSYDRNLMQRF